MSPDGTRLAVLRARYVGGKRSALIHLLAADNPKAPPYEIIIGDNDVIGIDWANEGRLMVTLQFDKTPDGKPTGVMRYNKIFPVPVTRLMFIGADGSKPTLAFIADTAATDRVFHLASVVDKLERDPDAILMQRWDTVQNRLGLFRVNVNTGLSTPVEFGERATDSWVSQDGIAVLRLDSNQRQTVFTLYARAPGEDKWKLLRRMRRWSPTGPRASSMSWCESWILPPSRPGPWRPASKGAMLNTCSEMRPTVSSPPALPTTASATVSRFLAWRRTTRV